MNEVKELGQANFSVIASVEQLLKASDMILGNLQLDKSCFIDNTVKDT